MNPNDAGFYALDRAAMRRARDELGDAECFGFFLTVAADLRSGLLRDGNVRDIAEYYGYSVRGTERHLTKLHARGWVEWVRPSNQYADGHLRIRRDLTRVKGASRGASRGASTVPPTELSEATRGNGPHNEQRTTDLRALTSSFHSRCYAATAANEDDQREDGEAPGWIGSG